MEIQNIVKNILYIYPPYSKKDEVKAKNGYWNSANKTWYVLNQDNEMFELYKRRDLLNNFELKEIYKQNGGKWDGKNWFTYNCNDLLKEYFL